MCGEEQTARRDNRSVAVYSVLRKRNVRTKSGLTNHHQWWWELKYLYDLLSDDCVRWLSQSVPSLTLVSSLTTRKKNFLAHGDSGRLSKSPVSSTDVTVRFLQENVSNSDGSSFYREKNSFWTCQNQTESHGKSWRCWPGLALITLRTQNSNNLNNLNNSRT